MKRSDTGDFCILYLEQNDEKASLFQTIAQQRKPIVMMLAGPSRLFQRPDDFNDLKHLRRQIGASILFVIPASERLTQLASRNGFPVYPSMDALSNALTIGMTVRPRAVTKSGTTTIKAGTTARRTGDYPDAPGPYTPKKTIPLVETREEDIGRRRTAPLPTLAPPTPLPVVPPSLLPKPQPHKFPVLLTVLVLLALAGSGIGYMLVLSHKLPVEGGPSGNAFGRVAYLSSNQISENSNQGINDKVLVDLQNLAPLDPGKKYYAWLISDKNQSDPRTILLGVLQSSNGRAQLLYPGDQVHTNLLAITSRFLVTEEDASVMPVSPTPDFRAWRYYAEIPQTPIKVPDNLKQYSYLDHLRHLLADEPTLDELELPGGLNTWFYRNSSKILEWTSSTREQWQETHDPEFLRRQAIRVLTYLDGASFVRGDVPAAIPLDTNERLARIGLLDVAGSTQDPASYLAHITHHLSGLLQVTDTPAVLRKNEADLVEALSNVKSWLEQVRSDAQKIAKMSDQQLRQAGTLTLINDMIDNATHAFVGQVDPMTGNMREGTIWIHTQLQTLATMDVTKFSGDSSSIQLIPDSKHQKALSEGKL